MNQVLAWIEAHNLLLLLALGTVLSIAWMIPIRKRLNMQWYTVSLLTVLHTLYGFLCASALAQFENLLSGGEAASNIRVYGTIFLEPLFYWLLAKWFKCRFGTVSDAFVPTIMVHFMLVRVNCAIEGCCGGIPIPGMNGMHFPTRAMDAAYYAVMLIYLCPKIRRNEMNGKAYPLYMITYGAFRFLLEFLRYENAGTLFHWAHLWSIISLCVGVSIYAEINKAKKLEKRGSKK